MIIIDSQQIKSILQKRVPSISGIDTFGRYSVLLPLISKNDEVHVLFEVRALTLRRQPGEICFPGGRIDEKDQNEEEAAVRETTEELGITKDNISIIAPLDYVISPFGTIIYPFVGSIKPYELINPNSSEVDQIFTVPLSHFLNHTPDTFKVHFNVEPEESFPYHLVQGGEKYKWQTRHMNEYFYYYEGFVIWGLTASIIKNFIDLISSK